MEEIKGANEQMVCESKEERAKRLEIKRVRNIACMVANCPTLSLPTDTACANRARVLILTYLLSKGYTPFEASDASVVDRRDITKWLNEYESLRIKNAYFMEMEANFLKKMELICSRGDK
jgi:hypothetical protein